MYNVVCHCNFLRYSSLVYLRKNLHDETTKHLNINSYSRYHTKQVKLLVVVVSMFELDSQSRRTIMYIMVLKIDKLVSMSAED
jgi:hypothetical protein